MPLDELIIRPWAGVLLWIVLYVSDYYCTIAAARMYYGGVNRHFEFEKGYELTPYFQEDIAQLRRFSWRFAWQLFLSSVFIVCLWYLSVNQYHASGLYEGVLGARVLEEVAVHVRHLHNLIFFWHVKQSIGITGVVKTTHWLTLRVSAFELLVFGLLWLLVFVVTARWFFFGGAIMCGLTAAQHWDLAKKEPTPASVVEHNPE